MSSYTGLLGSGMRLSSPYQPPFVPACANDAVFYYDKKNVLHEAHVAKRQRCRDDAMFILADKKPVIKIENLNCVIDELNLNNWLSSH